MCAYFPSEFTSYIDLQNGQGMTVSHANYSYYVFQSLFDLFVEMTTIKQFDHREQRQNNIDCSITCVTRDLVLNVCTIESRKLICQHFNNQTCAQTGLLFITS